MSLLFNKFYTFNKKKNDLNITYLNSNDLSDYLNSTRNTEEDDVSDEAVLRSLIDTALINKDKKRFLQLTTRLNKINSNKTQ